jgi:hypothetical protein
MNYLELTPTSYVKLKLLKKKKIEPLKNHCGIWKYFGENIFKTGIVKSGFGFCQGEIKN